MTEFVNSPLFSSEDPHDDYYDDDDDKGDDDDNEYVDANDDALCRARLEAGAFSAAPIPFSKSAVRE